MTIVIPSKENYVAAEFKKFIYECGRTFGIVQYDQVFCARLKKVLALKSTLIVVSIYPWCVKLSVAAQPVSCRPLGRPDLLFQEMG